MGSHDGDLAVELRAILDRKMDWILTQDNAYKAAASVFSGHGRGGRNRRPRMNHIVDIDERRMDFEDFLRSNCIFEENAQVPFEEIKSRFNEHRRNNRKSRVSWNSHFHIDALANSSVTLDSVADDKMVVSGIRWVE